MLFIIIGLIVLFIIISIVPSIQYFVEKKETKYKTEYEFPAELFDYDIENMNYEYSTDPVVDRTSIQNRGSVRLAQGHILSKFNLDERKEKAYSVELP